MNELYFAKVHQYDHRKVFKESWDIWLEENNIIVTDEVKRLTELGYNGNIIEKITQEQQDFFSKEIEEDTIKFIAEPGRYFVEKSHTLVLNVIGKKRETYINNDTNELEEIIIYYLNDGVYGSFNCIYFDHKKPCVLPFNERNEKILYKSKIFGLTCDSIDLITEEIMLPELAIGDWRLVNGYMLKILELILLRQVHLLTDLLLQIINIYYVIIQIGKKMNFRKIKIFVKNKKL
jgi:hypothetical protein